MKRSSRTLIIALILAVPASALPASPGTEPDGRREALEYAFRFASAIDNDPVDRAKSQQAVVTDMARHGYFEDAEVRAAEIEGWRGGVAYAELATHFATQGRVAEARRALERASAARNEARNWHGVRLDAHIAQAMAALGQVEGSERLALGLTESDPRQYKGRAAATVAAGHLVDGDVDAALASLDSVSGDDDLMVAWWRTMGYVGIAQREDVPMDRRLNALEGAVSSTEGLTGWQRAEGLEIIAVEFAALDHEKRARRLLKDAEKMLAPLGPTSSIKATLLANLARAWGRIGAADRARKALEEAEAHVEVETRMTIEVPGVWAAVASGYLALGDERAWTLYDRALTAAESLVNPRPRALAAVAICRSLGADGLQLPAGVRTRLDALLTSFPSS